MKEYLFVYGQFRDSAKNLLKEPIFCGKATIVGRIYKVNMYYPGFVDGNGKVLGDVYLFRIPNQNTDIKFVEDAMLDKMIDKIKNIQ